MITPKYIIKEERRIRVRKSIRKKIGGTPERPRIIFGSKQEYLYSQVVDDVNHKVITTVTTLAKVLREQLKSAKNLEAAKAMGEALGDKLKELKIDKVVFDRNIFAYTGRVKAFSDAVRAKGIQF